MYSFTYENNGSNTYLVYQVRPNEEMDTMTLGMLTNNSIAGLAPAIFTQMDSEKFIKYNVSAKVSAKQFFEGQVNKKRLIGVFKGIVNAIISAEDYMIDVNSIILDFDYIFSDVSSCETVLICLPVNRQGENGNLLHFFKTIMFSTQFDQTENCDYVAKIINYLNSASLFSVTEFKKVLDKISSSATASKNIGQSNVDSSAQVNKPIAATTPQAEQRQQFAVPQTSANQMPAVQRTQQGYSSASVGGTAKPPVKASSQKNNMPTSEPEISDDEKISFMYLMQHYNKENAAKYKAQKAAKKGNTVKPQKPVKQPQGTFTVPGASKNVGIAVPGFQPSHGYEAPKQQPSQSFAVPGQKAPDIKQQPQTQTSKAQSQSVFTSTQTSNPSYTQAILPKGQAANFGETTVLGGGIGATTILGASSQKVQITPHLIRTKNNEKINLDKPIFRIGKEKSYVDYFVSDNTAVSRSHANIIARDNHYFIVDTNSTNHTYVNGGMIQSNIETPLPHGAKIRLANEDFEFRLY